MNWKPGFNGPVPFKMEKILESHQKQNKILSNKPDQGGERLIH